MALPILPPAWYNPAQFNERRCQCQLRNHRNRPRHQPYVPDDVIMPEFTWPAVLVGAVLGIVFGASSLYLVLKVGMTVSASIPVAVLSITLFRVFSRVFGVRQATHSGEQHRADHRLGRRVDRLRRRRDHAGRDDPRLRDGDHPRDGGFRARRPAWAS